MFNVYKQPVAKQLSFTSMEDTPTNILLFMFPNDTYIIKLPNAPYIMILFNEVWE